jgi:hypothetical protein
MRTLFPPIDEITLSTFADEQALDDALACTFPASDPVAVTFHVPLLVGSKPADISQR